MLQQAEARSSGSVGDHDLAVQDRCLDSDLGQLAGYFEIGLGIVPALSTEQFHASTGQVGDRAYAVPLHLERPASLIAKPRASIGVASMGSTCSGKSISWSDRADPSVRGAVRLSDALASMIV